MQATVYIRPQDEDKWKLLKNKSEFISNALNGVSFEITSKAGSDFTIKQAQPSGEFVLRPPDPDTGYPCCTKKTPCKHWQFDSDKGKWVNILTGEEREAE